MAEINGTGGLCMTCNNQPTCYYHARRGPALFCELFDNYVPPAVRTFHEEPSLLEKQSGPPQPVEEKLVGLCMNCDHRKSCMHDKPASGVWHCEDYE
jgi:hypothetical protein